ncbi:MAG: 4-(cytidine 5'-diphospho)-2-C-methyl-D-erythritol kinase [Rhodobacteraceae bacterium]|nr:4-(cytidine 5'-diphospho)-2-C-methyl-D-erythritol kinase [Paracoccaceae bacterium]
MTRGFSETPKTLRRFAPAKINLALHVTGRRADGLHCLDSLVVFADIGDVLEGRAAPDLTLSVSGPMAAGLSTGADNLIVKAARLFGHEGGAGLHLEKNLPLASGIGGGSADAAAALHLMSGLWRVPLPGQDAVLSLGADLPVCLMGRAARMRGIGEVLEPVDLPPLPAVLVNPGVAVATPAVFAALERRDYPGLEPVPDVQDREAWLGYLSRQRNDLEAAAMRIAPGIAGVLDALRGADDCRLARMSGSGATCFGLFETPEQAARAASKIEARHPDWWCAPTTLR